MMALMDVGVMRLRGRQLGLALALLALALLATSLFFAFILPQSPGRMADPSAALMPRQQLWAFVLALGLPVPRSSGSLAAALLAVSAARFALYGLAVLLCWQGRGGRLSLAIAIGGALLLCLVAACALPNIDRDIYNYILSGRVAAVYGDNPYTVPPNNFPADPIYQFASPQYTGFAGDNKFPAWALLNIGLARLGGDAPTTNLLLYRSAFLLANGANIGLVALILRKLQPRRLHAGVVLYGWNPIVISYGQSKVDTIMVLFLLLGLLGLAYGRRRLGLLALGVSAWVKLITLPLVVVYLLRDLRMRRWRELALGVALLAGLTLALYAPFWAGLGMLGGQLRLLSSGGSSNPAVLQLLSQAGFGVAMVWLGYRRDAGPHELARRWALLALLFSLFLTRLGFSWYLLTLIALVAVAAEWRLALATVALSCGAFLMNVWDSASNGAFTLPDLFALPRFVMYLAFVAALAGAVLAVQLGRRGRAQGSA